MNKLKIKKGDKIKLAFTDENEKPQFSYISTFYKRLDDTAILISSPCKNGKTLDMNENVKILLVYSGSEGEEIFSGYCDDIIQEGIRKYWKIRIVEDSRKFYQRADERYKIILPIKFFNPLWETDEFGEHETREGVTSDISAGGIALKSNDNFEIGERILIEFPSVLGAEGIKNVNSIVCWQRDLQKERYKKIAGLQFDISKKEKEKIQLYIEFIKRRLKI